MPKGPPSGPYAVTGFGGVLLDNDFQDVLIPTRIEVEDAYLAGLAVAARVARPVDGLDLELEAQIVRHVHGQTHWEVNAPIATARWTAFPWDRHLDTSAAFGLGLSVASETPRLELANEGDSRPLMTYWTAELAAARPGSDWEWLARLHHRSTAYGTFGDDGGANALVLGLRRRFRPRRRPGGRRAASRRAWRAVGARR
ncbi:MAG: hypothetical protein ACFBWO_17485 [Paracoccaceae bacterium]